jgi:hypothetical protein
MKITVFVFWSLLVTLGNRYPGAQPASSRWGQADYLSRAERVEQRHQHPSSGREHLSEHGVKNTFGEDASAPRAESNPTKRIAEHGTEPSSILGSDGSGKFCLYGPNAEPTTLNLYRGNDDEEISPQ